MCLVFDGSYWKIAQVAGEREEQQNQLRSFSCGHATPIQPLLFRGPPERKTKLQNGSEKLEAIASSSSSFASTCCFFADENITTQRGKRDEDDEKEILSPSDPLVVVVSSPKKTCPIKQLSFFLCEGEFR